MRDIAALLSGSDPGEPGRLFAADGGHAGGLAAQAREWCQTPPDHAALTWLAVTLGARGQAVQGGHRRITSRSCR
jgi:hypothetical protein